MDGELSFRCYSDGSHCTPLFRTPCVPRANGRRSDPRVFPASLSYRSGKAGVGTGGSPAAAAAARRQHCVLVSCRVAHAVRVCRFRLPVDGRNREKPNTECNRLTQPWHERGGERAHTRRRATDCPRLLGRRASWGTPHVDACSAALRRCRRCRLRAPASSATTSQRHGVRVHAAAAAASAAATYSDGSVPIDWRRRTRSNSVEGGGAWSIAGRKLRERHCAERAKVLAHRIHRLPMPSRIRASAQITLKVTWCF
jgi:hypothetical protein